LNIELDAKNRGKYVGEGRTVGRIMTKKSKRVNRDRKGERFARRKEKVKARLKAKQKGKNYQYFLKGTRLRGRAIVVDTWVTK